MTTTQAPSPELFFDTMNAYQRTAALKAAIELDLFSAVGDGATAKDIAARCHASERGVRILSDYLTIIGFMAKTPDGRYRLTPDTALFLVRQSPAYLGGASIFSPRRRWSVTPTSSRTPFAAERSTRRRVPSRLIIRSGLNLHGRCGRWSDRPPT